MHSIIWDFREDFYSQIGKGRERTTSPCDLEEFQFTSKCFRGLLSLWIASRGIRDESIGERDSLLERLIDYLFIVIRIVSLAFPLSSSG